MLVIDQNRAHQRVLFEKFLQSLTGRSAVSQQLLFPLVLSFSSTEMALLRNLRDTLAAVGFVFGKWDDEQLEISGVPYLVSESEVEGVLNDLIGRCRRHGEQDGFSMAEGLAKTLSKTLAVRTGDLLEPASQLALVDDLFACKEAALSPFNKQVYVTITESEIDKKFN
jgi:DNA mismatch repair protein MutL